MQLVTWALKTMHFDHTIGVCKGCGAQTVHGGGMSSAFTPLAREDVSSSTRAENKRTEQKAKKISRHVARWKNSANKTRGEEVGEVAKFTTKENNTKSKVRRKVRQ